MNEVQEKLIELLNEIDEICQKNHIHYYLAYEAALSAYRCHEFESDTTLLDVFMTLPDALKFQKEVQKIGREDRLLDSIYVNENYPNLTFKYCNVNTLYINLENNYGIQSLGISVKISILRKETYGLKHKFAQFLESGWIYNYEDFSTVTLSSKRKFIHKCTNYLMKISKSGYKNMMLKTIESTQKNVQLNDALYIRPMGKKMMQFEENIFNINQNVEFYGKKYPIPENTSKYFEVMYGLRWFDRVFKRNEINELTIIDPRLPMKEYIKYLNKNQLSLDYQDEKMKVKDLRKIVASTNKIINNAWKYVLRTGARYSMWEKYMPQKENILNLYKDKNWNELRELFTEYDEVVIKNYNAGLGVCFDKEIYDIFIETLKNTGESSLADRLSELIPEQHLKSIEII